MTQGQPLPIRRRLIVWLAMSACVGIARAEVSAQTLCFSSDARQGKPTALLLRTYLDLDLQQEVGAFVQYGAAAIIPLVFAGDGSSDEGVDYELRWLEVVSGKINGEYVLVKPKGATIAGAFLKYRSLKTGRTTVFSPAAGSAEECRVTP